MTILHLPWCILLASMLISEKCLCGMLGVTYCDTMKGDIKCYLIFLQIPHFKIILLTLQMHRKTDAYQNHYIERKGSWSWESFYWICSLYPSFTIRQSGIHMRIMKWPLPTLIWPCNYLDMIENCEILLDMAHIIIF